MDEKKIFEEAFKKSIEKYQSKKYLSMTAEEIEQEEYEMSQIENGERFGTEMSEKEMRDMQKEAIRMNLAKFRKAKGLMQSELANAMGLTQSRITEYETGRKTPRLKRLQEFAEFFGCEVSDLLDVSSMFGAMEELSYQDYVEVNQARHPGTKFLAIGTCEPFARTEAYGKILAAMEKMNDYELTQYYLCAVQLLEESDRQAPDESLEKSEE